MKQEENKTKDPKHLTGEIGEEIATLFLKKRGFTIVNRNYRKKWGELDIVAKNNEKIHFIEVKTTSLKERHTLVSRETNKQNVSYETGHNKVSRETSAYKAEDRVTPKKRKRLKRAIQSYLLENLVSRETEKGETPWQFDIITVYLSLETKQAKVDYFENWLL